MLILLLVSFASLCDLHLLSCCQGSTLLVCLLAPIKPHRACDHEGHLKCWGDCLRCSFAFGKHVYNIMCSKPPQHSLTHPAFSGR